MLNGSPSLRLRGGINNNSDSKKHELNQCTSAMSPETQRLLPPTSETIMTKPFPIRGSYIKSVIVSTKNIRVCDVDIAS